MVWRSKANPIARGWVSCVNIREKIIKIENIDITIGISENSLKKILALGVKDKESYFFSDVLRKIIISFLIYKTSVFFKLLKLMTILNFYYFFPIIRVLIGLWVFVAKRKHLLNTLLRLEYIMLNIFWVICVHVSILGYESYFILFFLTLAACEGALGLALLVSIVRRHGNDCFNKFRVLQC